MKYEHMTGKKIQDAFEEYHKVNPHVYDKFKELAFMAINRGKSKISFKMIMNVIRWEHYLITHEPTKVWEEMPTLFDMVGKPKAYKLNDAYGSRYARLFIFDYPNHEDKIELRRLRS